MFEKGNRTKRIYFWMSREDAATFSDALLAIEGGQAWRSGPDALSFPSLATALDHDAAARLHHQAFTLLPFGLLMFNSSQPQECQGVVDNYSPQYEYPPRIQLVRHGSLAIRWNTEGADRQALALFEERLKAIWAVLRQSTLPAKVHSTGGLPLKGWRIGPHMLEKARTEGLFLHSNGPICLPDA